MAEDRAYIDEGGDGERPSVDWSKFAETLLGVVSLGYFRGLIGTITVILGGLAVPFDRLGDWFANDLIGSIETEIVIALEAAWLENIVFLEGFGVLAPVVAAVQFALVTFVLLVLVRWIISRLLGGIL